MVLLALLTAFSTTLRTDAPALQIGHNIAANSDFSVTEGAAKLPSHFSLSGAVSYGYAGYRDEISTQGVLLDSSAPEGSVSQTIDVDAKQGKWFRFRIRARAEDGFLVKNDQLFLQMEFYADHGARYEDKIKRLIYREITRDREALAVNGDDHKNGAAVWRTYELEELLPFPDCNQIKFSVGFEGGVGKNKPFSRFMVGEFYVEQERQSSDGRIDPADRLNPVATTATSTHGMVPLGGRWFYRPLAGEKLPLGANGKLNGRLLVTEKNSSQLFYKDDRLTNPFAGNMTAWLRKGYLDEDGNMVRQDRFVPDNLTVEFDGSDTMALHARNLPNHPTARFPDTYGTQGYNPSYIQEHNDTYRLPLSPKLKEKPVAMDLHNTGMALQMGPTAIAVNGVVFFNPFDAGMTDATSIMDRCCGHPSPDYRYHYHKYPTCVNTPFLDKGDAHSPVIGFAFDGLPIYGPYEAPGVMAKDSSDHPLNAFNAHYDAVRGWHYHVTPGKFPYVIGGYFAELYNF